MSIDVLLSWTTTQVASVTVQMESRRYGKSNYTFRKLVRHTMNMLTGYSVVPLRIVTFLGLSLSLLGFVTICFVLVRYVTTSDHTPGFTFIVSTVAVFSGTQLLAESWVSTLDDCISQHAQAGIRRPSGHPDLRSSQRARAGGERPADDVTVQSSGAGGPLPCSRRDRCRLP